MTTTTYLQLQLLDVGQKEKEATINANMDALDTKTLRFLGDLAADPATTGIPKGSSYFNTTSSLLRILRGNNTWVNA
jgi:hypothetical protein